MNQLTLTDMEYSNRRKKTKREEFLDAMEGIETMLRMYPYADMVQSVR